MGMFQNPNDSELKSRLDRLTEDLFIRDGNIYRTVDMQGHGSDYDQLVSKDINDPKYKLQIAAWRLLQELNGLCKNGKPHRMHRVEPVPAHYACVDCGVKGPKL